MTDQPSPMPPTPSAAGSECPPGKASKGRTIAAWVAQLVAAGIFVMGALPKFTGFMGGADALVEKLGGKAPVMAIGVIEIAAIVLLLIPKTAVYGSIIGGIVMIGAVASHIFGPVGMEGDLGGMLPMALIGLAANATAFGLRCKELPFFKKKA